MKNRIGFLPAVLALLAAGLSTTAPVSAQSPVNGSFEDGLTGWDATGNVSVMSGTPYVTTNGTKLAVFNGTNTSNNGILAQDFPTSPGQGYVLDFDAGNLAYVNHDQKIRVTVTQNSGAVTLLDVRLTIPATTLGGATTWRSGHHTFTAGAAATARITFTDESAFTASQDLVLDHVRILPLAPGLFASTGSLPGGDPVNGFGRMLHAATVLADGKVLISGGWVRSLPQVPGQIKTVNISTIATAQVYDPALATWSNTGSLSGVRNQHTATLLNNGKVLVVGGNSSNTSLTQYQTAELYDPATGTWSSGGTLAFARRGHTATLLPNGKVMVAGGETSIQTDGLASAELYDPLTNTWSATGSLASSRTRHTATLLANGKVLVAGGFGSVEAMVSELYDPATGNWSTSGPLAESRVYHTATLLQNGKVLVAGGDNSNGPSLATAQLYDPAAGTWTTTGPLAVGRQNHTASLLPDGKVLVAGGTTGFVADMVVAAELYDPVSGSWSSTGSLATPRLDHTATTLANGRIMVTGGWTGTGANLPTVEHVEIYQTEDPFLTVTTLVDENDGWFTGGTGNSLREAVAKAGSLASPPPIHFAPGLNGGTIVLGGTAITHSSPVPVTIDASSLSSGITVSGNHASQVFRFIFAPVSTLKGLTITASSGSAIEVGDTGLNLVDCVVRDNTTTGNGAAMSISGSFTTITGCTFSGNTSTGNGGAIHNNGLANISNSTFSGNHAGGSGGGIRSGSYSVSGMTVTNCTFSGNSSVGDGGAIQAASFHLNNSTVSGNTSTGGTGGGIASFSASGIPEIGLTLTNSIVAGNTAPSQPDLSGVIDAQYGTNFTGVDPKLGPLETNGGKTKTMKPLHGSPVINAAGPQGDPPALDQRGLPRASGTAMDAGAVEIQEILVNTLADENDGVETGGISLRDAVAAASPLKLDRIGFIPALSGGTIVLGGTPILAASITTHIDASDLAAGLTVSGNHTSGVFRLLFVPVTLRGLTITASSGAAVDVGDNAVQLIDCIFTGNNTTGDGAALLATGSLSGSVAIDGCVFSNNTATGNGGAIFNDARLRVRNSTFTGNHAGGSGGAIRSGSYRAGMTVTNSTFTANTAATNGGAIHAASFHVIHATITGNTATSGQGGGISSFSSSGIPEIGFNLANSVVSGNTAPSFPDVAGPPDAQYGVNFIGGSALLAPLAHYGGKTATCPPLPGSPLIDAATALPDESRFQNLGTDQSGRIRPSGPLPDIGAMEAFPFSILPLVDSDGDGVDDRLEPAYGLVVGANDTARDSDGDGSTDAMEIANMTNPVDSSSLLKITSFVPAPGFDPGAPVFEVSFTSFPGLSYALECHQNLDFTGTGAISHPAGIAVGSTTTTTIPMAPGRDFVRVLRKP